MNYANYINNLNYLNESKLVEFMTSKTNFDLIVNKTLKEYKINYRPDIRIESIKVII
jgi:hypothetical protein